MAAAATERCRVWPKTAAQDVKCVRAHCRGAGSIPPFFSGRFRRTDSRNTSRYNSLLIVCPSGAYSWCTIPSESKNGRPERGVAFNGGSTLFKSTETVKHLCTTHCIFTLCLLQKLIRFRCGFSDFKTKLDANALFVTFTHRKNRYDINARVTSATYCSQLSKRSHLQLVSWVAKTCTNMSRLVANTSHRVNNHYISNPDTIWTNLVYTTEIFMTHELLSLSLSHTHTHTQRNNSDQILNRFTAVTFICVNFRHVLFCLVSSTSLCEHWGWDIIRFNDNVL